MTTHTELESAAPGAIEQVASTLGRRLETAVSIVIPAFNEGAHVAEQVRDVRRVMESTGWDFEIIVVDDGSEDDTAQAAAATGVRVLRHPRNRGYGASLKRGIAASRFDWILITDADGTYPANAIPGLLARAEDNDMVVGARTGERVAIPLERRPAKWFLRKLASYLAGMELPDLNSGLRLMRRELVERYLYLLPSGFSFTTTITLASACNEHSVEYVPINYLQRLGRSKIRPRHAYDFMMLILRTIVFFNPLKVFIPLGAFCFVLGIGKFMYDVVLDNISESAIFFLLSALIIWCVGMLADQNAKVAARR